MLWEAAPFTAGSACFSKNAELDTKILGRRIFEADIGEPKERRDPFARGTLFYGGNEITCPAACCFKNRKRSLGGHPYKNSHSARRAVSSSFRFSTISSCINGGKSIGVVRDPASDWEPEIGKRANATHLQFSLNATVNASKNNNDGSGKAQFPNGFTFVSQVTTPSTFPPAEQVVLDSDIKGIASTSPLDLFAQRDYLCLHSQPSGRYLNTNPLSSATTLESSMNLEHTAKDINSERKFTQSADARFGSFTLNERQREHFHFNKKYQASPARAAFFDSIIVTIPDPRYLSSGGDNSTERSFVQSSRRFKDIKPSFVDETSLYSCSSGHQQNYAEYQEPQQPSNKPPGCRNTYSVPFHPRKLSSNKLIVHLASRVEEKRTPSSRAGQIYNNNANAASAHTHGHISSADWSYLHSNTFSDSPTAKSCVSSLNRVSLDFEGSDVTPWRGETPAASSFLSKEQEYSSIYKQTTPNQSGILIERKYSNQVTQGANHPGSFPQESEKIEDRFQDLACQVEADESRGAFLSENNHHSVTSLNSDERCLDEDDREVDYFPKTYRAHPVRFYPYLSYSASEMGCIQSIANSKVGPDKCHRCLIVEDIQAVIDRTPTYVEEKSHIVLRYRTPYFRASAHVIVPPIPRKETWTIGWIQACDSMKFINQYGRRGSSSWEIPALKDRRITAVSDSDGVSYPWYGSSTEIATVVGPTKTSRSLSLRMNDNFYPSVTWDIPVSEGSDPKLTHIVRDQSFTTWLAAVNLATGRLVVLRTVKWHYYVDIDVDPTQELGKRARIVSSPLQKQPVILKSDNDPLCISSPRRCGGRRKRCSHRKKWPRRSINNANPIPKSALVRPSANNAQALVWRPTRGPPVVVVPAKEQHVESNEVVWFKPSANACNVRVMSSQEMSVTKHCLS